MHIVFTNLNCPVIYIPTQNSLLQQQKLLRRTGLDLQLETFEVTKATSKDLISQ